MSHFVVVIDSFLLSHHAKEFRVEGFDGH